MSFEASDGRSAVKATSDSTGQTPVTLALAVSGTGGMAVTATTTSATARAAAMTMGRATRRSREDEGARSCLT
jgi:hypothetical protein